MAHQGHLYRLNLRGRSMRSVPGVGGTSFIAQLQCSRCDTRGERRLRELMPPEQIDRKFIQAGWSLDPNICVDCKAKPAKEKPMASKPSPAAMKAQVSMLVLLQSHFDADAGAYAADWSDARIATETGLAEDVVTEYRRAGFGEIKEPAEVRALRADINALAALQAEQHASVGEEIAGLRSRLADVSKRWAA